MLGTSRFATLAVLTLVLTLRVAAQQPDPCDTLPKAEVPEQDRPTLADLAAAMPTRPSGRPFCSALDLYYSREPRHFQKARACVLADMGIFRASVSAAQARQAQSQADGGATFPDPGDAEGLVLTMIYANGEGIVRNLPLARRFLCDYGGGIGSASPDEQLKAFDETIRSGARFDMCAGNGESFGRSTNFGCLAIQIGRALEKVSREQESIVDATPPALKPAFLELRAASSKFFNVYESWQSDVCAGGTGCGVISEQTSLDDLNQQLAELQSIRSGIPPARDFTAAGVATLDRALNARYQEQIKESQSPGADDPSPNMEADLRAAGRAWLKLREAWVRYGTLRWPNTPADQWRAWQTSYWTSLLQ